jgi:hypothetical protein
VLNCAQTALHLSRDVSEWHIPGNQPTNLNGVRLGQFCVSVVLTFMDSAICDLVFYVGLWRVPPKIRKAVVSGNIVGVAALHSRRAWTYEGQENKAMHRERFLFQADSNASLVSYVTLEHSPLAVPQRPDSSVASSPISGHARNISILNWGFVHLGRRARNDRL